jgi:hypothetical protein
MIITKENREKAKSFANILKSMGVERDATGMIISMLKDEEQLDEMVNRIEENLELTQEELIEIAAEISGVD